MPSENPELIECEDFYTQILLKDGPCKGARYSFHFTEHKAPWMSYQLVPISGPCYLPWAPEHFRKAAYKLHQLSEGLAVYKFVGYVS